MGLGLSRRSFIASVLPLALLAGAPSASATGPGPAADERLIDLGQDLTILRRRTARLRGSYLRLDAAGDARAPARWREWSHAIDDCADLARRIRQMSAITLAGTIVKLDALIFELCEASGDSDLGDPLRRRLVSLRRELVELLARG